mmetsp:Transcript_12223/g.17615  ORF Transcript_12223/g.17615 Transcript_12223/m.17615 type:complete len:232 (-) Transcript_12223:180-875(-)|eukprot:CAMPEP_0172417260 /NCGR_PEP_ID=MMETSP1064-20121228/3788_1 /TAXON_ID=202472 /ORGANISM="Aulacoseira subarctica , Strain CCAP 1002/5" /LENGTH=231 /DNA_ID=CAMNT_0013155481 /DNA_START=70 /DNA_END=765 /DNA_ORIENTATION=+
MEETIDRTISIFNHWLNQSVNRIPPSLLSKCAGVAIIHPDDAPNGHGINGILLRRDDEFDEWSPPVAISAHIISEVISGKSNIYKIMVFMNQGTLRGLVDRLTPNYNVRFQEMNMVLVAGPKDCWEDPIDSSKQWSESATYCYSLSNFGDLNGFTPETGVLKNTDQDNFDFYKRCSMYKRSMLPKTILFTRGAVAIPEGSRLPELYKKLNMMQQGVRTDDNDYDDDALEDF